MSNLFNFQGKQYAMTPQVKLKKVKDKLGLSPAHRMQFTNDGQNLIVVTDCAEIQIISLQNNEAVITSTIPPLSGCYRNSYLLIKCSLK